jgi:hypothetical protein
MKKLFLLIIFILIILPVCVFAENEYVIDNYDISVVIDNDNKKLHVTEIIETGKVDREIEIHKKEPQEFVEDLIIKSNSKYYYDYEIDLSAFYDHHNGNVVSKGLVYYFTTFDSYEYRDIPIKYNNITITITNSDESSLEGINESGTDFFDIEKHSRYIKYTSKSSSYNNDLPNRFLIFEKEFNEPTEKIKSANVLDGEIYVKLSIIVAVLFVIVLSVFIILLATKKHYRKKVLTTDTNKEFYNWYLEELSDIGKKNTYLFVFMLMFEYSLYFIQKAYVGTLSYITYEPIMTLHETEVAQKIIIALLIAIDILISICYYIYKKDKLNKFMLEGTVTSFASYTISINYKVDCYHILINAIDCNGKNKKYKFKKKNSFYKLNYNRPFLLMLDNKDYIVGFYNMEGE